MSSPAPKIEPRIKSRPLYGDVVLDARATLHIFICNTVPSPAFIQLMREAEKSDSEAQLWLCDLTNEDPPFATANHFSSCNLQAFAQTLSEQSPMGTAVYILGEESFIWDVAMALKAEGFADERLCLLPPVSNSRRLFCTHCYHTMEHVTYSPVACEGCSRLLLVRDHFSRRLGAYVGLHINAEDPTETYDAEPLQ